MERGIHALGRGGIFARCSAIRIWRAAHPHNQVINPAQNSGTQDDSRGGKRTQDRLTEDQLVGGGVLPCMPDTTSTAGTRESTAAAFPVTTASELPGAVVERNLGVTFGLAATRSTVGRVLAEARIRPYEVRGWLIRAYYPAFWARPGAVCRLYPHPEPGTA